MKFPRLNRSDRVIAAILVVMVILSALVSSMLLPTERQGSLFTQPSTFHNDESGAKAMWLAIDRLGYDHAQLRRTMTDTTLAPLDALFVLAPLVPFEEDEARTLRKWVENGGVLVYVPSVFDSLGWLETKQVGDRKMDDKSPRRIARTGEALSSDDPLLRGIEQLSTQPAIRFDAANPVKSNALHGATATTIWRDEDGAVLVRIKLGRGQILALGDSYPLSNLGLKDPGNAALLAAFLEATAGPQGNGTIGFDEYHHGYLQRDMSPVAMWKLLIHGGRGWGATQLIFAVALALFLAAVRFGAARDLFVRRRRQQGEFIEAAGAMLAKAGGVQLAWETMCRQYRSALARAVGLPATTPVHDLVEVAQQRGSGDLSILATTDAARIGHRDLLHMAQRCHDAIERLKRGN